jgi:hypothetical protein
MSKIINLFFIVVLLLIAPLAHAQIADLDSDGLPNTAEDVNNNQIVDSNETDPNDPDTDRDGYNDGLEVTKGSNPLDFNSQPSILAKELDSNGDGLIDQDYSDVQLLNLFGLTKVIPTSLSGINSCTYTEVIQFRTILSCKYELLNNGAKYTLGGNNYRARPFTSDLETRCNLEQTNGIKPYLNCTSIAFNDATLGNNSIILLSKNSKAEVTILNTDLSINISPNPESSIVRDLTPEVDKLLERSCIPVEQSQFTTCSFILPKNYILPPIYSIAIGSLPSTEEGSNCFQLDNSRTIQCDKVTTTSESGPMKVYSSLSGAIQYSAIVSEAPILHSDINTSQTITVKIQDGGSIPEFGPINTAYKSYGYLVIYDSTNKEVLRLEGLINANGMFVPIDKTITYPTLKSGIYKASIEPTSINIFNSDLKKITIIIEVGNVATTPIITPRTGGELSVIVILLIILVGILLHNNKSTRIAIYIIMLVITVQTGISDLNIKAQTAPLKNITAFTNFQCNPKAAPVSSKVNCTMELTNALDPALNFVSFSMYYENSSKQKVISSPCFKYKLKLWSCPDLKINYASNPENKLNGLEIKLGGTTNSLGPRWASAYDYSTGVIAKVNSYIWSSEDALFTLNSATQAMQEQFNVGDNILYQFQPFNKVATGNSVFYITRNGYDNSIVSSDKANLDSFGDYTFTFNKTSKSGKYIMEACVGVTDITCKSSLNKLNFDVVDKIAPKGLFGTEDPTSDRINIVFACDNTYPDIAKCEKNAKTLIAMDGKPYAVNFRNELESNPSLVNDLAFGLMATEPYKSNRSRFDFYIVNALIDLDDDMKLIDLLAAKGLNKDRILLITTHETNGRSNANIPDYSRKPDLVKADMSLRSGANVQAGTTDLFLGYDGFYATPYAEVISHELGHALFGLLDEYEESGNLEATLGFPNCMDFQANATSTWTKLNGGINPVGSLDPFYNTWISEFKKYGPVGQTLDIRRAAQGVMLQPDQWTVKDGITGGCFGPKPGDANYGKGKTAYRSTQRNIMTGWNPVFGTVNRDRAQQILNQFSGIGKNCANGAIDPPGCLKTPGCTNGANNPPTCNVFPPCNNTATNPPLCNTFPPCSNKASNPPLCTQFLACANGANNAPKCDTFNACTNTATNPPKCDVFKPCQNKATNPPKCDKFLEVTASYCPIGTIFDANFGFCGDKDNIYGPFPKAISDLCVAQFPKDTTCTATKPVEVNKLKVNLQVYPRARFSLYRGTGQCPVGTSFDKTFKNYCVELDTATPTDMSKASIFGPFTQMTIDTCASPTVKGGTGCYLVRYSYNLFKFVYKP